MQWREQLAFTQSLLPNVFEAKVVTPLIRSNLPGRVALRTASEADSTIVLGGNQTAAAYLLGKGDLLYQLGSHLHRLQSLLATTIQL